MTSGVMEEPDADVGNLPNFSCKPLQRAGVKPFVLPIRGTVLWGVEVGLREAPNDLGECFRH